MSGRSSEDGSETSSVRSFDSEHARGGQARELNRVQSITSSLSRVHTNMSNIRPVQSIRRTVTNAREDNAITAAEEIENQQNDLGRILTHADISDAMKVAKGDDSRLQELVGVRPDDTRAIRRLKTKTEATDALTEAAVEQEEEDTAVEKKKIPPVDRGYAWVICAAEFVMIMSTWGAFTSFGVYISFWLNNDTFGGVDPVNYAMSSSIALFLAQGLAPVAMISFNMVGYKLTAGFGAVVYLAGYLLCSFCTKLWQLYCTQGLLLGVGFAFVFIPSIVLLSSWFVKYRALSSGLTVGGAGAGGVLFALASQALITKSNDFRWAMRMVGIVTAAFNVAVISLIKERVPAKRELSWKELRRQTKIVLNIRVMKHWHVMAISLWFGFGVIAYIVLTYSLSSFATFLGMSQEDGSHITAIFNGCQAIGRVFIGMAGDRYGRVNVGLVLNVFVVIIIFAFFINVTNFGSLVAFAVVSGLVTGWTQLLNQAIMPDSVPLSEFPSVWSYENIIVGCFTLFCEVAALKLRSPGAHRPFIKAQIFSGVMVIASTAFIIPIRAWKVKNTIQSRLDDAKEELEEFKSAQEKGETSVSDSDPETLIRSRIERYEDLLQPGVSGFLKRLSYPIKV